MKLRTAALLSLLGMTASAASALAIPVPRTTAGAYGAAGAPSQDRQSPAPGAKAHFSAGQTLMIDARLGHASVGQGTTGETFLFASVTGSDGGAKKAPPMHLAVVVDRSGSMKGDRIANAIAAAIGVVERMRDDDFITVVAFDTEAITVVPPTRVGTGTRPSIEAAIRSIRLGGDTCISCGLESAMRELGTLPKDADHVDRMILLSDGATNHGVRDLPGLRQMAGRMRDQGMTISTIGVDVDFDEKVMSAIASEANGRHHFVATPAGLPAVFAEEFDSVLSSVARDAELEVELAPGVEVDPIFDRSFRREGQRVFLPMGTFSSNQEKTALLKLRVPAAQEGRTPVASVRLAYRDLVKNTDGRCGGELALDVVASGTEQKDLDPFVAARFERSRTAKTLEEANLLMEKGDIAGARVKIATTRAELDKAAELARRATPVASKPKADLGRDFEAQLGALAAADDGLVQAQAAQPVAGTPAAGPMRIGGAGMGVGARPAAAPPSREAKVQARMNQEKAQALGF